MNDMSLSVIYIILVILYYIDWALVYIILTSVTKCLVYAEKACIKVWWKEIAIMAKSFAQISLTYIQSNKHFAKHFFLTTWCCCCKGNGE